MPQKRKSPSSTSHLLQLLVTVCSFPAPVITRDLFTIIGAVLLSGLIPIIGNRFICSYVYVDSQPLPRIPKISRRTFTHVKTFGMG